MSLTAEYVHTNTLRPEQNDILLKRLSLYPLLSNYDPKDRGMLWFYVEAARRPQWC